MAPMITAGAKRLAKGVVELAHDERYQLPGRCLICFEPESARRAWRTRTRLGGSLPGGGQGKTFREYSLDLSLPYCATHVQLYDAQTKASVDPPWPSAVQADEPGFSARMSGQIDTAAMGVTAVTVMLRFGDASYAKEVALANLPRLREILGSDAFGLAEQVRAAQVLAEIGDAGAAETIAAATLGSFPRSDRSVDLGGLDVVDAPFAMARELGRLGEWAAGPLARMLKDDRPEVRRAAVHGLSHVGTSSGVELLSQALGDDPHNRVRAAAATSLGKYLEDPKARRVLEKASGDPSRKVRRAVKKALKRGG